MSDTADTMTNDSTDFGGTPATESAPVGGDTTTESSILDTELPVGMRTFDRSYVEKLRAEAGTNRAKAREAEALAAERAAALEKYAAFDGYSDDDMQVWASMASDWKTDPAVAAQTMQTIAMRVLGDPTATAGERADAQAILDNPAVSEAAETLTPEKVREIAREESAAERAEREREADVQGIFRKIEEAGYVVGSPQAISILAYANTQTNGDIDKALELQKQYEQSIVDNYVKSMAAGGTPVRLPSDGQVASPVVDPPKDLREAKRAADAWLAERYSSGQS